MRISYRNFARVGWRARIGVIAPGTGLAGIADFHKIAPEGVAMCATILPAHPYVMYRLAKDADLPEADGIFISCTGLSVLDIVEKLEHDLGKLVVTSNQASFWHAFQIAKVREPIQGYSRLLSEP